MYKKGSYKLFSIVGLLVLVLSLRIINQATATHASIGIEAIPGAPSNIAFAVDGIYQEPDFTSRVTSVITPGEHFNILGYDESGAFTAIAMEGQSTIAGWIPTSQVARTYISGTSLSLSFGYRAQSATSIVTEVLTPGQKVMVLGHSPDGNWLAIANLSSMQNPLYWVARTDISLPVVVAKTLSLAQVHQRPSSTSLVTNVLDPTYQLVLIGRTNNNAWYAARDFSTGKYLGWLMSGDLVGGSYRELLPVISLK